MPFYECHTQLYMYAIIKFWSIKIKRYFEPMWMGEHEMQMEKQLRDDTITHNESYFHIFNGFVASNTVQHKHTHTQIIDIIFWSVFCFRNQKKEE